MVKNKTSVPLVTVIMPIRNEQGFIEQSLRAVLTQTYPHHRLEVLIADGMSEDATRDTISKLMEQHQDITVEIIDNHGRIVSTGFNKALSRARGEIIVRVDGHCVIAPDYVMTCVRHLSENEIHGVGGPIETIGLTTYSQAIARAMSSVFGVGNSAFRTVTDKKMFVDTVAFPAYTREAINLAGVLDEELVRNQDDEYNFRLRKLGANILLAPDVRAKYYSRASLRKLWRQYFDYGFYKVRVLQKHPRQMSLRHFVPPVFVLTLLGLFLLGVLWNIAWFMLVIVLVLYFAANLSASFMVSSNNGWAHFTRLPLIFSTLHIAYGSGFLLGLIKFWNRWRPNG